MKPIHLIFSAILLVISMPCCNPQPEQLTVPEEKLARIMADLYIAEAATLGLTGISKDSLLRVYNAQVFQIHGITPDEYEKNLKILAHDEQNIERVLQQSIDLVKTDKDAPEPERQPEEE